MDATTTRLLEKFGLTVAPGQKMPLEVPNFSRDDLAKLFAELNLNVGAEVGVEQGKYSEVLLKANPKLKLYAIDAWEHYRGYRDHVNQAKLDGFYAAVQAKLKPFPGATVVKGFSMDVVRDFPEGSLDFVYIDGNHAWDWVAQDIIEWSKRVRKGGIVSGHDWVRRKHERVHVVQATQMYTYCHDIALWFLTNEQDSSRSWFWVKP